MIVQLFVVEKILLFIYRGGMQKLDLNDLLGGWMYVEGAEKVGTPKFILPLTD